MGGGGSLSVSGAGLPVADGRELPERAAVYWRPRVSRRTLRRSARWWTFTSFAHTAPFTIAGVLLAIFEPVTIPVALVLLAHAWVIPELYAARGANVVRPRPVSGAAAERRALGLLGDLLDGAARDLQRQTGLVLERGALGIWLVGEAGALLVQRGGRRVFCWCVRVSDGELPSADRIAHLLLALRTDEAGFATVANLAFCGAPWRVRRRLDARARAALQAGLALARDRA
jgi:hypothetical protein